MINTTKLLDTFRAMCLARNCDRLEMSLIRQGVNRFHLGGQGAEINAVLGAFACADDYMSLHWRDRALRFSAGLELSEAAASFFAISGTEGGGKSLTCHESRFQSRLLPIATPVASHCLPACGVAWALDSSSQNIVICSLGDGGTRQGEFLEAIAFAIEKHLRILFVVIDNEYAISTRTAGVTGMDLGLVPTAISTLADTSDFSTLLRQYEFVTEKVRNGGGPQLLHLRVPRLGSHTSNDDQAIYRDEEDLASLESRDLLPRFRDWLSRSVHISEQQLVEIEAESKARVKASYEGGRVRSRTGSDISIPPSAPEGKVRTLPEGIPRLHDSINQSLRHILANNQDAIVFGEDVEDPLGGVFRLTRGLSTEFPGRVINSPLAEATIIGVGCGRATVGKLTIVEVQFIDFISPGWNQLVTNVATQYWRTDGAWECPLVIYAPADGYCPGEGIWHSQVNARGYFTTVQKLKLWHEI